MLMFQIESNINKLYTELHSSQTRTNQIAYELKLDLQNINQHRLEHEIGKFYCVICVTDILLKFETDAQHMTYLTKQRQNLQ